MHLSTNRGSFIYTTHYEQSKKFRDQYSGGSNSQNSSDTPPLVHEKDLEILKMFHKIDKTKTSSLPSHYSKKEAKSPDDDIRVVSVSKDKKGPKMNFGALFKRWSLNPAKTTISKGYKTDSSDSISSESEPKNFLRRLSKRRKKPKKIESNGTETVEGFLKVPIQNWERTKKQIGSDFNNYSSSGSLSQSIDSSSLYKNSRKEAMKQRAENRRKSLLLENSSSGEDESFSSLQGSYSSLSNRTKRKKQKNSPSSKSPLPKSRNLNKVNLPNEPKWEAKVVYTQENLEEGKPIVVRLPVQVHKNPLNASENFHNNSSNYENENGVISAGLKLPLKLPKNTKIVEKEPIYANVGLTATPPPPPRRDFKKLTNFTRPVSCSYLESVKNPISFYDQVDEIDYLNGNIDEWGRKIKNEREILLDYEVEPKRYGFYQNKEVKKSENEPIVKSKLGYPIRKLNETSFKISENKSPVSHKIPTQNGSNSLKNDIKNNNSTNLSANSHHNKPNTQNSNFVNGNRTENSVKVLNDRNLKVLSANSKASEFWRRREKISSPINSNNTSNYIRSAECSPLLVRRKYQTDSISSMSSLSSPSPQFFPPSNSHQNLSSKNSENSHLFNINKFIKSPDLRPKSSTPNASEGGRGAGLSSPNFRPGKNLEEALNELEEMYKSLRLSDEDLLDRAERRDLPTPHQELRGKDLAPSKNIKLSPQGSLESLATTSGSGSTDISKGKCRTRAPPMRRSGIPDLIKDDMANRKYESKENPKFVDSRDVVSQTGSYLVLSPAFSPPVSPSPDFFHFPPQNTNSHEPDITTDDVSVINYRRANAIKIINEPQPLFGIPIGPAVQSPSSDYLHATPSKKLRPLYRHVKNPDLVGDDQAFRNLRKDLGTDSSLGVNQNWTPRLFKSNSGSFDGQNKKLRAVRSLSANISHLINPPHVGSSPNITQEIGRWNNLFCEGGSARDSRSLTPVRASNYLEPSWVQQAHLEDLQLFGTSPTTGAIQKKFKIRPKEVKIEEKKSVGPKPWTQIILESFEKDDEVKREESFDNEVFLEANDLEKIQENVTKLVESPKPLVAPALHVDDNDFIEKISTSSYELNFQVPKKSSNTSSSASHDKFENNVDEKEKRKSWLGETKQYEDFTAAYKAIGGGPKKIVFTPLPPPRKIRQISLEGFQNEEKESKVDENSKNEKELNLLLESLVKEAESCGNNSENKTSSEKYLNIEESTTRKFFSRNLNDASNSVNVQGLGDFKNNKWGLENATETAISLEKPSILSSENISQLVENKASIEPEKKNEEIYIRRKRSTSRSSSEKEAKWQAAIAEIESGDEGGRGIKTSKIPKNETIIAKTQHFSNNEDLGENMTFDSQSSSSWSKNHKNETDVDKCDEKIDEAEQNEGENKKMMPKGKGIKTNKKEEFSKYTKREVGLNDLSQNLNYSNIKNEKSHRDSLSDVEGMTSLRKLLYKETSKNSLEVPGIKKSPSAGNSSYWSKIYSSQPSSFIKKIFDKVSSKNKNDENLEISTVSQKASLFNKSKDEEKKVKNKYEIRPKSRFSTQPVTSEEVQNASNIRYNFLNAHKNQALDFGNEKVQSYSKLSSSKIDNNEVTSGLNISPMQNINSKISQWSDASKFRLKDRVNMFNKLSTTHPKMSSKTSQNEHNPYLNIIIKSCDDIGSDYDNLISDPLINQKFDPKRSFVPFSQAFSSGPNVSRSDKVRSLYEPSFQKYENNTNIDYLSEDGEFSSGGQEVAEIISKSYENSPIIRKKSWRSSQKIIPGFLSREILEKYGKTLPDPPNVLLENHDFRKSIFVNEPSDKSASDVLKNRFQIGEKTNYAQKSNLKTTTSNLFPILAALSSSDDQISSQVPEQNNKINLFPYKSPPPRRKSLKKILREKRQSGF